MFEKNDHDVDVEAKGHTYATQKLGAPVYADETGAVPGESFASGNSTYARLQRFVGRFGVEQRGIERVPEDERTDTNLVKVGTMWFSANMVVSSFAIGVLSVPVFDLGFVDSLLAVIFFNLLGIMPVCFFSCFGPKFGLRQMVLSRFFFGYYGVKAIACFNVLACVGWSSVNVIVGAQLINAVNPSIPGYGGIIIIAACTFLVTLFGYKVVHAYEFWSWIPSTIVFLIVLGEFAHSGQFVNLPMGVGKSEIGSILSFGASVFGFATGWTSYAADYTCYQPVSTPRRKVWLWTFAGLAVPLIFTELLGVAIVTAYQFPPATLADPSTFVGNAITKGYNSGSVGGLLGAVLLPPLGRFGQFCLVMLALSIVANNCPNIYSLTFSLQVMGRWTQAVPRFIWTFLGTLVYCAIAIPGYSHFEQVLQNFMLLIGYWLAIYSAISLTDHIVFKRGFGGYDIALYNSPGLLPPGVAAIAAFLLGVIGAVLGMAQTWWIGPIGRRIGDPKYGGDIGFELAFCFAASTYLVFRTVELRIAKR